MAMFRISAREYLLQMRSYLRHPDNASAVDEEWFTCLAECKVITKYGLVLRNYYYEVLRKFHDHTVYGPVRPDGSAAFGRAYYCPVMRRNLFTAAQQEHRFDFLTLMAEVFGDEIWEFEVIE